MAPWNVFVLLYIFCALSCDAKITSIDAEIKLGRSDCSNTISIEKSNTQGLVAFSPDYSMDTIAHIEGIDNDSKTKKKMEDAVKPVIKPCSKDKKDDKKDSKKQPVLDRLRQKCTRSQTKGTPWHVILYRTDENIFFCQGVLIDSNWVITIAHCLIGYDGESLKPDKINVVLKASNKRLKVNKIYTHEDFRYATFTHDIALLNIESTPSTVTPICLPVRAATGSESFTETWWEGNAFSDTFSGDFFQGKAKSMNIRDCKKKVVEQAISYSFDGWQICSENPDFCSGDMWLRMNDASPLYTLEQRNAVLVGLKSWGSSSFSCEAGSEAQVHVDVFKYMKWITSKLNS